MGKKSKENKVKKSKKDKTEVTKGIKKKEIAKTRKFLLAKINDEFIITDTNKYGSHYEWLNVEKNIGVNTVDSMVLGILKVKEKGREIVLFTGEDKKRVNRTILSANVILNLHNICRDTVGVGNYKVYTGLKIDNETGKELYISSILDFDVRKPVKHTK